MKRLQKFGRCSYKEKERITLIKPFSSERMLEINLKGNYKEIIMSEINIKGNYKEIIITEQKYETFKKKFGRST